MLSVEFVLESADSSWGQVREEEEEAGVSKVFNMSSFCLLLLSETLKTSVVVSALILRAAACGSQRCCAHSAHFSPAQCGDEHEYSDTELLLLDMRVWSTSHIS